MLRGFHHKFIEIHMDTDSGHEAHDCLFFLWHRRYLLAYENMLRSLGDEYRCITLPYWDVGTLSTKFATGACQYFPDCNPLLSDMGGLETGTDLGLGTYAVADKSFNAATCIRSQHPVTRNFCQSWTAYANKTCLRCIPRNKWAKALPPPDVYIENVYNQLFSSAPYDFTKVTKGVQYRYHNAIHGALSSTMGTFAAPGDPIFYIHHVRYPIKGKRSDGTYIEYQPTDRMTMKLVGCNGGYVDVQDPSSILKPFFDAIGRQTYAEFNNIQDLGANNSYSYDFGTSSLGVLATQCDKYGRPTASTLLESTASATEGTSPYNVFEVYTSVTETVDPVDSREDQFVREMFLYCKSKNVPDDQIMERINWMQCVFHNECKQGVFDYTTEFQSSFGIQGPPYCYTTISRLANRTISIGVPGWEQVYSKHYTCQSTVT
ncbi:hypothetical protein DYB32_008893 [Aphanomyces invadans]|uniref:Tyrosinase copper-binding domain-containing protein n=1 Tax=Aphanomyces invadans TaxID=157072 RepID=A0A418AJW6_9STRA|nr:hypothetical protein DYB32_008893 [Aphanomyces invadans]